MQAFRDHLCADENVDLPGSKVPQGFAIGFLAGHRIRVHSAHHGFGEKLGDCRFHFLSAEAVINQRVLSARRTFFWNSGGVPAQMTAQSSSDCGLPVKCERHTAVRTISRLATIAAQQRRGKTASV
jgi:hypothetical protein